MSHIMSRSRIAELVKSQHDFFMTHETKNVKFRLENLKKLKNAILRYENKINDSLKKDLGKSRFESYAAEIGLLLEEISFHIHHLKKWAKPTKVRTDLVNFYARSYIIHEPFGISLIIAPWNYPFQLLFMPLIGAVAAGNCVLAKPSRHAVNTNRVMKKIIGEIFDPAHVNIIEGGSEINKILLEKQFDYIFFTGSTNVGKKVLHAAAPFLTPVSLELGGKSPAIIEPDAPVAFAAKRIMWGKLLNAGQSCVAPDYLLVHKDIRELLVREMKKYLDRVYGPDIKDNPDYARIINQDNALHLAGLIEGRKILIGGESDPAGKYIAPTVVEIEDMEDILMQEEIFPLPRKKASF